MFVCVCVCVCVCEDRQCFSLAVSVVCKSEKQKHNSVISIWILLNYYVSNCNHKISRAGSAAIRREINSTIKSLWNKVLC